MTALDLSAPKAPPQYIENKARGFIRIRDHPLVAKADVSHAVISHGVRGGALISVVLGTELPGPGTLFLEKPLKSVAHVRVGDTIIVRAVRSVSRRVS